RRRAVDDAASQLAALDALAAGVPSLPVFQRDQLMLLPGRLRVLAIERRAAARAYLHPVTPRRILRQRAQLHAEQSGGQCAAGAQGEAPVTIENTAMQRIGHGDGERRIVLATVGSGAQ